MKKVSIVLPTYNRAKYLKQTIDNCLNQTYQNIEIVIINDASTDNTDEIVKSYREERIKYIALDKNVGPVRAYNKGFAASTGDYLTWTSDDNYYSREAIEIMADFLDKNEGTDFVYTDFYSIDKEDKVITGVKVPSPEMLEYSCCIGPCFLYKRGVYEAVGEFDENTTVMADYDYWARVFKKFKMQPLDKFLYYFREHTEAITSKYGESRMLYRTIPIREKYFSKSEEGNLKINSYKSGEPDSGMKILILSNGCSLNPESCFDEISDVLRKRGHKITIVAGNCKDTISPMGVYKNLTYHPKYNGKTSLKETLDRELKDNFELKRIIKKIKPDILYVFDIQGLTKSLLISLENSGLPTVYDISGTQLLFNDVDDNWLMYWQLNPGNKLALFIKFKFLGLITKKPLKKWCKYILSLDIKDLNLKYLYFVSNYIKLKYIESNFIFQKVPESYNASSQTLLHIRYYNLLKYKDTPVIYRGIDTNAFSPISQGTDVENRKTRLLCAGKLIESKGAHILIEALSALVKKNYDLELSILETYGNKGYFNKLLKIVERENLPVKFLKYVNYKELQKLYVKNDIFISPVIEGEAFDLFTVRAMAAGLVVISSDIGGIREHIKDTENCLIFEPGNSADLASKLEIIIKNKDLKEKITRNSVKLTQENFDIEKSVDKIENYLNWAIKDFRKHKDAENVSKR